MKKKAIDLGNPKTFGNVLYLMIPAMISQLITVLYNIVDRIYIGNLPTNGQISLIGAGVCAPIATLVTSFAYLVVLGASPLFSMSLGQGREEDAENIFYHSLWMLLVLSLIVMGLGYAILRPMLYWFGASDASFPYAREYMLYFLIGTVPAFFSIGFSQFLVAQGRSVHAMTSSLTSAFLNVVLDPLFMYAFGLGIKGAAIATSVSWSVSALLGFFFIMRSPIRPKAHPFSFKIVLKILKLGCSPFIILATDSVILIGLNAALQMTGDNGDFYIECATIVQAFFSLVTGPLLGISSGTQSILAYLYGSKKTDLVKKAELQITMCGLIFTSVCFALSFFLAEPFAKLFLSFSSSSADNAQEVIAYSSKYIHWYMYPIILLTFQYTLVDGLTGIGQAKYSIWLSINRKFFLLLPLTFLLPYLTSNSELAFLAEPIADAASGIVSLIVCSILFPKILKKQASSKDNAGVL